MPASSAIRVKGLRDLQRAFGIADRSLQKRLRSTLREVAEPVRAEAEALASDNIRNIGEDWPLMRVGVTQKLVYVAPQEKGRRSGSQDGVARPNLAPLLMDRAMSPALDNNASQIEDALDEMLGDVGNDWERA